MFASEIYAPKKIRLIQVEEQKLQKPKEGQPGEIMFQPELGCLCGSDLICFERDYKIFPNAIGHSMHELIGTVVDTTGKRFKPGDRVLCVPLEQRGIVERFAVSEERAIPLDTRKPQEQILMSQPLGTAIFSLRKLGNVIDKNVVVVGQGPMGQLFSAALNNLGARRVIALDKLEERLAVSLRMGATDVLNPCGCDAVEEVRRMTDGQMADLVVEVVGHREMDFKLCVDLCRHGGQILGFGLTDETVDQVPWFSMHLKNINLQMSMNPDFERDFPLAMRWIAEGRIDVTPIITHRYNLDNIQAAFELFFERRDGAVKVLIDFPRGR